MISKHLTIVARWPLNTIHPRTLKQYPMRKICRDDVKTWIESRPRWTTLQKEQLIDWHCFQGVPDCWVAVRHPFMDGDCEDIYKLPSIRTGHYVTVELKGWTPERILREGMDEAENEEERIARFMGQGYYGP